MVFVLCHPCKLAFTSYVSYCRHATQKHPEHEAPEEEITAEDAPKGFSISIRGRRHPRARGLALLRKGGSTVPKDKTPTDPTELPEEEKEEEPTTASPPAGTAGAKRVVPAGADSPSAPIDGWEEDDGSAKLITLLDVMGVPPDVNARIVGGYRVIGHIRAHPANLHQFLMTHFFKKPGLEQQVPVIVQEMMPYLGRDEAESGPTYLPQYARADQRRPSPYGGYGREWDPGGYDPPPGYFRRPTAPTAGEERESPAIKELRTMVTTLTETYKAEREERRLKEAGEERKREQEATEARYAGVSEQVGALAARLEEVMATKASQEHEQVQSSLAQEVSDLRKSLADRLSEEMRSENASLKMQLEELKDTLGGVALKMEQIRASPAGRSAEDLIAELGPAALEKIDSIGTNVKEELAGWREKMTPGGVSLQGPGLRPPTDKGTNPAAGAPSPVDEAKEIARRTEAAQAFLRARAATSAAAKPPAAS